MILIFIAVCTFLCVRVVHCTLAVRCENPNYRLSSLAEIIRIHHRAAPVYNRKCFKCIRSIVVRKQFYCESIS